MSTPLASAAADQRLPEPGVEPDGIDTGTLLLWGSVSIAVVVGVMFGSAALYFAEQRRLDAQRVVAPLYMDSEKLITDQRGVLAEYAPPAGEGKPYAIPVERAKQLVLAELRSKRSE